MTPKNKIEPEPEMQQPGEALITTPKAIVALPSGGCCGNLVVSIFEYPDSDGCGGRKSEYAAVSGHEVTLTGRNFGDSKFTNSKGEVSWSDLVASCQYGIEINPLTGYKFCDEIFINGEKRLLEDLRKDLAEFLEKIEGDEARIIPVEVKSQGRTRIEVGCVPMPVTIKGRASFQCGGNDSPIVGATIECYQGCERVDCTQTQKKHEGCEDGEFTFELKRNGLFRLVPCETVTADGRIFRRDCDGLMVFAAPGQTIKVPVPYCAVPGVLRVNTYITQGTGCDHDPRSPLPSPVMLYKGLSTNGKQISQATTPAEFSNLQEGFYTLAFSEPQNSELANASDGIVHAYVREGQIFDFGQELVFIPSLKPALPSAAAPQVAMSPASTQPAAKALSLFLDARGLPPGMKADYMVYESESSPQPITIRAAKPGSTVKIPVTKAGQYHVKFRVAGQVQEEAMVAAVPE